VLLCDNDKEIRNLFGVRSNLFGLLPGRATYVIDKKGTIQMVFNSMKAKNHIQKALDIIKKIQ
jgi:peroxiredoxin Q/BCP